MKKIALAVLAVVAVGLVICANIGNLSNSKTSTSTEPAPVAQAHTNGVFHASGAVNISLR